jgi:hypothetical protein
MLALLAVNESVIRLLLDLDIDLEVKNRSDHQYHMSWDWHPSLGLVELHPNYQVLLQVKVRCGPPGSAPLKGIDMVEHRYMRLQIEVIQNVFVLY